MGKTTQSRKRSVTELFIGFAALVKVQGSLWSNGLHHRLGLVFDALCGNGEYLLMFYQLCCRIKSTTRSPAGRESMSDNTLFVATILLER